MAARRLAEEKMGERGGDLRERSAQMCMPARIERALGCTDAYSPLRLLRLLSVCAFHLHFDDEALHSNISNWRTHRLPISKSKRHGDRGVVLDFWHILTEFVAARNATKRLAI